MTENAFKNIPNAIVSNVEAVSQKTSYTVKTVEIIRRIYPKAQLLLLMGTDMYLSLEMWKDYEHLLSMITPAVFSRDEGDSSKIHDYAEFLNNKYGICTEIVRNPIIPISSSQLRQMLSGREGIGYINDTNYSYIISGRWYGAKPQWEWLRAKAYQMLDQKRIPHVAACETVAVKLAERWGVEPDYAREAAILHDITKRLEPDEHLRLLVEHGVFFAPINENEEKLLHAVTGSVLAKSIFGVPEQVEDAIRWHTTGKAGMSMLAKVLYIADYIEETRDFPGVEELYRLAFENIDKAMIMGLEMTVSDLASRGISPAEATIDALTSLMTQDAAD